MCCHIPQLGRPRVLHGEPVGARGPTAPAQGGDRALAGLGRARQAAAQQASCVQLRTVLPTTRSQAGAGMPCPAGQARLAGCCTAVPACARSCRRRGPARRVGVCPPLCTCTRHPIELCRVRHVGFGAARTSTRAAGGVQAEPGTRRLLTLLVGSSLASSRLQGTPRPDHPSCCSRPTADECLLQSAALVQQQAAESIQSDGCAAQRPSASEGEQTSSNRGGPAGAPPPSGRPAQA